MNLIHALAGKIKQTLMLLAERVDVDQDAAWKCQRGFLQLRERGGGLLSSDFSAHKCHLSLWFPEVLRGCYIPRCLLTEFQFLLFPVSLPSPSQAELSLQTFLSIDAVLSSNYSFPLSPCAWKPSYTDFISLSLNIFLKDLQGLRGGTHNWVHIWPYTRMWV